MHTHLQEPVDHDWEPNGMFKAMVEGLERWSVGALA